MHRWLGRALIVAGTAGMVYGVYLWMGKAAAVILGSFIVYVAGFHLTLRKRGDGQAWRVLAVQTRLDTPDKPREKSRVNGQEVN